MSRLLFLIAAGVMALAAQTPVGGPSLGFIFDARGQALRPILGIPGASLFGDPLNPSDPISTAALSLHQNVAIINDGAWKSLGLTSAAGATVLPDGLPVSARVAVSETGTAAAFYDSVNGVLSVVTGIPSAAAVNSVNLSALPGAITKLSVGDDGSLLLSASVPAGGEALFWIGQDGSSRQLASLTSTASILLWHGGANALVADRGANQVWTIQDPGGNAAITLVASDADGVSSPSGAALSAGGSQLWIANSGTRTVLGIDMNTRATVSLNCAFKPEMLAPMADGRTFQLNRPDRGPLWILDTTSGTAAARVVFVPGLQSSDTEAAQ